MRSLWVIGAGAMMAASGASDVATAQQRVVTRGPGATYGRPTPHVGPQMQRRTVVIRRGPGAGRWGSQVGGRWWGGANAPGGWNAYRRQTRGYVLPSYWIAPRFYVTDWQAYGLTQPTGGYRWVRYYDDAVLVDQRGSVFDTVENVDWDGSYAQSGADDGQLHAEYDDAQRDDRGRGSDGSASDGLGGAAVGAVAGGVAGNVIAGRGNRLGGTLIGAGVGAAAGYAIDRSADRRRRDDRDYDVPAAPDRGPPPGAGYANPGDGGGYHHDGHPRPPHGPMSGGPAWTSPDGRTTVVTSGGYAGGYGGGSVTTVTVHSAPIVTTTTTTETWEDDVTYTRAPARKMIKRTWKPRAKTKCLCR